MESWPHSRAVLVGADLAAAAIPLLWWAAELAHLQRPRSAKFAYISSVLGLYGCLLVALNLKATGWITTLVVASAAFHATEYIALVSYYAGRRKNAGQPALFQRLARSWTAVIIVYLVALALVGFYAQGAFPEWWWGINLWAAFLHYAYDGMIWKLRQPTTAERLAV
jgi:hypothetical protein